MIGQRCFYNDHECTIRWIGHLEGLESERVGIELDVPSPERHSGEYKGKQIFKCRANCGAFVKTSKISFSIEQAVNFRYKISDEDVCSNLVGLEKIRQKISALDEINFACLEKSQISRCGDIAVLTHLTRLRLSDNLIQKFSVITDIAKQLPLLLDLDLTGNSIHYKISDQAHQERGAEEALHSSKLKSLVLCRTGASNLDAVLSEIRVFPRLALLNFEDNAISEIPCANWPTQLTSLDLSKNQLTWPQVAKLPASLVSVNLDSNALGNDASALHLFQGKQLCALLLHACDISDWSVVQTISEVFEKLENFRITGNFVYQHPAARQVIIASFPALGILNGAEIREKFRVDAEKYVAHSEVVHPLVLLSRVAALKAKYPREQVAVDEIGQTRKTQGIKVVIGGLNKSVQFTTIPSMTVAGFRKLAVKRSNWPIDLADTEIRWSQKGNEAELGCAYLLENSEDGNIIGDIFGQNANISVFLSVKDKQ